MCILPYSIMFSIALGKAQQEALERRKKKKKKKSHSLTHNSSVNTLFFFSKKNKKKWEAGKGQRVLKDAHKLFGWTGLSERAGWRRRWDESIKIRTEFCNCVFTASSSYHCRKALSCTIKTQKGMCVSKNWFCRNSNESLGGFHKTM